MAARHKKPAAPSATATGAADAGDGAWRSSTSAAAHAATRQAEIETKLEIAPDAKLPSLSKRRRLAAVGIACAADPKSYHLDAMYYDTTGSGPAAVEDDAAPPDRWARRRLASEAAGRAGRPYRGGPAAVRR